MSRLDLHSVLQSTSNVYGAAEVNTQSTTPVGSASAQPRVAAGDQTSVSQAAALVAKALSGSDVRAAKVAALQQAIQAGTYSVPASAVADKLIGSLLQGLK